VGFVGRGRIITEERVEFCGTRVVWYVVLFMDDAVGRERPAGSSVDLSYANAIKARWEKETCAVFGDAPIKNSATGMNSAQSRKNRKKPVGRDAQANSSRDSRKEEKSSNSTDSVTSSN